jgi:hypothetical protein
MRKVISFSVWGTDPSFVEGAIKNALSASVYYPGWESWIYCDDAIFTDNADRLRKVFNAVFRRVICNSPWEGLFWRFEPATNPTVEAFISRDCDSRLNPREAAAVQAWLDSSKKLHTMRDHYEHIVPILGGMWGCRAWPEFGGLLLDWTKRSAKGTDQDFLHDKIWPLVRDNDCLAHDRYTVATRVATPYGPFNYDPAKFFGEHNLQPFPAHRPLITSEHGEHVGARVK